MSTPCMKGSVFEASMRLGFSELNTELRCAPGSYIASEGIQISCLKLLCMLPTTRFDTIGLFVKVFIWMRMGDSGGGG